MKKKVLNIFLILIFVLSSLFFSSCDKSSDGSITDGGSHIPFFVAISFDGNVPKKYNVINFGNYNFEAHARVISLDKKILLYPYTYYKTESGQYDVSEYMLLTVPRLTKETLFTNSRGETYHPENIRDAGDYVITWKLKDGYENITDDAIFTLYLTVAYPN